MTDFTTYLLAWLLGLMLGTVFYGGLWWTIRVAMTAAHPALWFLCSWLLRTGIALTGFYFIGRHHWQALLWCLLGFIVSRFIVSRVTRPSHRQDQQDQQPVPLKTGINHAPHS